MTVGDQQAPRPVGAQVVGHAAGAEHGHRVRGQDLLAQEHQAGVVADVPVRQEDAVRRRAADQGVELGRHVGGCVEEVGAPARPVDEPEAGHLLPRPPSRAGIGAEVAVASQVRDASVLGDAQHRQRPARVGILHRPRPDRRGDHERSRQGQESEAQTPDAPLSARRESAPLIRQPGRFQPHDAKGHTRGGRGSRCAGFRPSGAPARRPLPRLAATPATRLRSASTTPVTAGEFPGTAARAARRPPRPASTRRAHRSRIRVGR